ncbi:fimbrial protein [Pseudomonas sp. CCM 7893]|uniref:Fimbrial protein n=1 Tax=Pseudomonas spelaei TaxID=1055469 RepID=A0A6I3WL40_9PSED|nr:fimbrial protein [Pseudomonas spelaei]MUF07959.1 fimbrial protein [Pseudomonas spelaei]
MFKIIIITACGSFFLSTCAIADCVYDTGGTTPTLTFTPPKTLVIPRNAAIGTKVYTSPIMILTSRNYTCDGVINTGVRNLVGTQPVGSSYVYPIGNSGLAFKWSYTGASQSELYYLESFPNSASYTNSYLTVNGSSNGFEIIKVGPVQTGAEIPAGNILESKRGSLTDTILSLSQKIVVTESTCTTPNIMVSMGDQKSSGFSGVGSRLTPKAFNIALNACPEGIKGVKYRLDPTTEIVDPTSSVIALSKDSSAIGVAVQILDNIDKPLPLGTDLVFSGYKPVGGNFIIPLKAAYYQTAKGIKGGTANSSLTFTMTYE